MFVSPSRSGENEGNSPESSRVFLSSEKSFVIEKSGISLPLVVELKERTLWVLPERTSKADSVADEHSHGIESLSSRLSKSNPELLCKSTFGCFAANVDIYVCELQNIGCTASAKEFETCIRSTPMATSNKNRIVEIKER